MNSQDYLFQNHTNMSSLKVLTNQSLVHSQLFTQNDYLNNQTEVTMNEEDYQMLFKLTQKVTGLYLMPVVSILGIIGNILIVAVYAKSQLSSTNIYLITLSLTDILKLANDFLYFLVTLINLFDANLGEKLFKGLYLYSHYVFLFTAINTSWLTCAIALDRYISIVRNKRLNKQPGYFKTLLVNIIIFVLSSIISIPSPLFLMYDSDSKLPQESMTSLTMKIFTNQYYKKGYNIFNSTVKAYIPLILTVVLDYQIIRFVYNNKMKKKSQSKKSNQSKSRVSLMLITIVSVFAFCMVPDSILTMLNLGYANESYLVRSIREITDLLLAINSASTFPICIYFSIQFRLKLNEILMIDKLKCGKISTKKSENNQKKNDRNVKTKNAEDDDDFERVSNFTANVNDNLLDKS